MDIIQLNNRIEDFINQHDLTHDALALKKEYAIQKSDDLQAILDGFTEQGRVLRIGIIGRVKAGKSSMLNALLFNGNDILPKAATPMTAALTVMEYSESIRAEVDFYTEQDIADIKAKHDVHAKALAEKVQEKEKKLLDIIQAKNPKNSLLSPLMAAPALTEAEKQDCREKAQRQAEREMKDASTFAAYDHYQRIQAAGKSLSDLAQYQTIQADSVEALMNGALNQFVGADGEFMPFTKSVTLYIPEQGLQGLQIIDTPGINDPVTSRGERTEQLLAQCDVVLVVSPSGQFLSNEDTELLNRVTSKEGTQQAYIIASQVDNQLFGSENQGLSNPNDVLQKISGKLTTHARGTLTTQMQKHPEMKVAAEKLMQNEVICSSSVAFSMLQRFDAQHTWDANLQHVWRNLNQKFPDTFAHAELAKNALQKLANIEKLRQIIDEVTANKAQILAQRRVDFENSKRKALHEYLMAWQKRIGEQVHHIQTADVGELRQQQAKLQKQQATIQINVGGVYDDLVSDIKLNLDKQLKDKLSSEMKKYEVVEDNAEGTTTESKSVLVYEAPWWKFWASDEYETRYYEVITVNASSLRRALEDIRDNLEDELHYIAENYSQAWKKKIYQQIVGALRESMGDDELNINLIARAVKNVLARIPDARFELADDMPSSLKKTGTLKGSEAQQYLGDVANYKSNLRDIVRSQINQYMSELVDNLKQINLPAELTGDLESNLKQLLHEIENKEASLFRYQNIHNELKQLQQEAAR